MATRELYRLCHFGFRNFVRKHAADPDAPVMYVQHNLGGRFAALAEETLQHMHDEFHRRVIIVKSRTRYIDGFLVFGRALTMVPVLGLPLPEPLPFSPPSLSSPLAKIRRFILIPHLHCDRPRP